jgi:uncharacterized Zn finger protein
VIILSYLFSGLIKCKNCGKNYRYKLQRKKSTYICSGFSNYGKQFCKNLPIDEEEIINVIKRHFLFQNKKLIKPLNEYVDKIEVMGEGYKIFYKDGTYSLVNYPNENGVISLKY